MNDKESDKQHYKIVQATSIKSVNINNQKIFTTQYGTDFTKASNDFYIDTKYINSYQTGYTIGKYGSVEQDFGIFIKRLKDGVKEIITDELRKNNITSEYFSTTYNAIDAVFDVLIKEIKHEANINLDIKSLIVKLHGFINGYIEQIKIKE